MIQLPSLPVALWIAGLAAFVVAGVFASMHDTFPGDQWLARQVQQVDIAPLTTAMGLAEDLAQWPLLAVVALLAGVAFGVAVHPSLAPLLVVPVIARYIVFGLKEIIERPRPDAALVEVIGSPSGFSFPSGHAFNAAMLYGLIFVLATASIRNLALRTTVQAACVAVIVLTSLERVYVGHHWPSDVLFGLLLGFLALAALLVAYAVAFRRQPQ